MADKNASNTGGISCPTCGTKGGTGIGRDNSPRKLNATLIPKLMTVKAMKNRRMAARIVRQNTLTK